MKVAVSAIHKTLRPNQARDRWPERSLQGIIKPFNLGGARIWLCDWSDVASFHKVICVRLAFQFSTK